MTSNRSLQSAMHAFPAFVLAVGLAVAGPGPAVAAMTSERAYDVDYVAQLIPAREGAQVTLTLAQPRALAREFRFRTDPEVHRGFEGDGTVEQRGEYLVWLPPPQGGSLSWFARLTSERKPGVYDGRVTGDWAVFRGDDLIPPASLRKLKGAYSRARLRFILPTGWSSITPYREVSGKDGVYLIVHEAPGFDRPTGWMAAGHLGVRWETIADTRVAVAGPVGEGLRRQDILAFLRWTLPTLRNIFPDFDRRLLVVGAGDPMWRGGLSGPGSLYIHTERPLISENGTSTLLHELVHVAMSLRAENNSDWIVEGLAELYSLEVLHRSGTISARRYENALRQLHAWGKEATTLFEDRSAGALTGRAVVVLKALDEEIRTGSSGRHSLDDLARELSRRDRVSHLDLLALAEQLVGSPPETLAAPAFPAPARR